MLKMTRLRLINWHNFVNDCLPVEWITLIIGTNSVGKTTIMDAIRYCLTTNKDFNSVGNKNSCRTLQGSVHAKQHISGRFSRPGHTVSYIGCEIFDSEIQKNFVIAVRIESESPEKELRHILQDWYISAPGIKLEDIPFIDEKTNTPNDRTKFRLPDNKLKMCISQKDAKAKICRVLGIGNPGMGNEMNRNAEKFLSVFHMGTSLDGISDIRDFIYAYILPTPEVNPEELDLDRRKLEEMQDVLNVSIKKKVLLNEINTAFNEAFEKQRDVDINDGYIRYAEMMDAKEEISLCSGKIEHARNQKSNLDKQRNTQIQNRKKASDDLTEAQKKYDDSDDGKKLEFLNDQKILTESEYKTEISNHQTFEKSLNELNELCNKMRSIQIDVSGYPFEHTENAEIYSTAKRSLLSFNETMNEIYYNSIAEKERFKTRLNELYDKIKTLKSGKFVYPDNNRAEQVKSIVNKALEDAGMTPDAKILCDLLQMNEDHWQNAVEVCLGRRRFDIIVSPEHYSIAKQAFITNRAFCRGISLVDTPSLIRDKSVIKDPDNDELGYKVATENRYARLYVNTLLYQIHCCENSDDIEKYPKSITHDCIRHIYYRTECINTVELYIGLNAKKSQLEAAEREQKEILKKLEINKLNSKTLDLILKSYNKIINDATFENLCNHCCSLGKSKKLYEEIRAIQRQIDDLNDNPLIKAMFDLIKSCQKKLDNIFESISELDRNIGKANDILKNESERLPVLEKKKLDSEEEFDIFSEKFPHLIDYVKTKYDENSKTKCSKEIVTNQKKYHNQLIAAVERVINDNLVPKQREYNRTYSTDFPEGIESFRKFSELYNSLLNIELEKNIESVRQAKERCKERFRSEILYRLKDDILNTKRQFAELNRILAGLEYGEESYRFEVEGSSNPELSIFYDVIMSQNNAEIDLFNIGNIDTEIFENQIDELMNKIMADIEAASKARVEGKRFDEKAWSKYADYRTYLDYDIKITSNTTGEYTYLSKVNGEGSGGETQASFYVAICASLLQIYNQSKNSIRLVLLDEAFSHMTPDRIKPMIKMFKEMNLQVILISTAEKCTEIQPFCDSIYSVIRKGSKNSVMSFIENGEADYVREKNTV
ncbi:MAG: ATP-binding protein [Oscillospiraceae bacterium]